MLTEEEKATNFETMRHIERVRNLLNKVIGELLERGEKHDQSKLESPEVEAFTAKTKELCKLTYGSPEYEAGKKEIDAAIQHHYARNRHHIEHHKNGLRDMNLIDVVELICDWKAASERHNDGNIKKSIEINARKYNIPPELVSLLENTLDYLE